MEKQDLIFLCDSFYNLTGLPIRYYEHNEIARTLPAIPSEVDPIHEVMTRMLEDGQSVNYYMSEDFLFYGKVKELHAERMFLIGPCSNIPLSSMNISSIMVHAKVPHQHRDTFKQFLANIPPISFENFLHALCFFNFSLNRTRLTAEKLLLQSSSIHPYLSSIQSTLTETRYQAAEEIPLHDTYRLEQQILAYVRDGDTKRLAELFETPVRGEAGPVAKDALRQEKNILIVTAALVSRAAIQGGLDIETALHLSDIYIQQAESLSQLDALSLLRQQLIYDYAEKVAAKRYPSHLSSATLACIRYIKKHINTPILVREIAESIGISPSYLARTFKQEMGMKLNDYINQQKIEEAKNLLAFTDRTLSEISSYLCFSSQSYFQNLFKKYEGTTPLRYRQSARNPSSYDFDRR